MLRAERTPGNYLGVKGVGESDTIGAPAIANAVINPLRPLGIDNIDMPFLPRRVWQAIASAPNRP